MFCFWVYLFYQAVYNIDDKLNKLESKVLFTVYTLSTSCQRNEHAVCLELGESASLCANIHVYE